MRKLRLAGLLASVTCLCALAVGPISGAFASEASIKAAFKSYSSKVDIAEGHVTTAIGEYKTSKEPAKLEEALKASETVLTELKAKIEAQSAGKPRVKEAKTKIVDGLQGVITAYKDLATSVGEKSSNPEAAQQELTKFLAVAKKGLLELREGEKLLLG